MAAVELALSDGVATKTHVLNILHRPIDGKAIDSPAIDTPQALLLRREPKANVGSSRRPARPQHRRPSCVMIPPAAPSSSCFAA